MFTTETRKDVEFIADQYGWNPAALLAVVEVESNGTYEWDIDGEAWPPIRWEGHYFYKRLKGKKLQRAVALGLAHPDSGGVPNPKSYSGRYDLLARARNIDEAAALESISMGLGQVMGAWWKELGYESPQAMFERAKAGIAGQVEIMSRYIQHFNLGEHLKGKPAAEDFARFAKGYNGAGYKKNDYDTKLVKSYNRWVLAAPGVVPTRAASRSFTSGYIKSVQADLTTLGYDAGPVDGIPGKKTVLAVRKFQTDNGLVVDGKPGPMTRESLAAQIQIHDRKAGEKAVRRGTAVTAPAVGIETGQTILEKISDIQASGLTGTVIDVLIGVLTVVGVGLLCYGLYKQFKARGTNA